MALYSYRGVDAQGVILNGYVEGNDRSAARLTLDNRNIQLISLRRYRFVKPNARQIALFFSYISYALRAGYTISNALPLVQSSFRSAFQEVIKNIRIQLVHGRTFYQACAEHTDIFSAPILALLHVGEQSGCQAEMCEKICHYLMQVSKQQSSIFQALAYPCLSFVFFIFSFLVLLNNFLPNILTMLKADGKALPLSTRILCACTELPWLMIISVTVLVVLPFRPWRIWMRLMGSFWRRIHYARSFTLLQILLQGKISLMPAFDIIADSVPFYLKKDFQRVFHSMCEGQKLAPSLKLLPHLSAFYIHLILIGESTGHLVQSLALATELMQQDIQHMVQRLNFWAPPILMAVIGLGLWFVISGTFIPLYESLHLILDNF